jgi:hexosaminidase
MKLLILFTFMLLSMANLFSQSFETRLIPYPEKAIFNEGKYPVTRNFPVSIQGHYDDRIFGAVNRFLQRLDGRTGLFFNQFISKENNQSNASFSILINRPGNVRLNENESYSLTITSEKILLKAETDLGAIYGLETLLQLLSANETNYYFPACNIDDKPRFAWRGLLIDVGRHFMPLDLIKRNIDGMVAVKMNVLHLHLTEDQGFRVESKVYPKLHQLGSDGKYFTQEQIKDIIGYANERGVRVVPEFDIPGHATSWFVGHPELASAPGPYSIERGFGVMDPTMDPTIESTYEFLEKFLGEMAQLFNDEYLHIGGDENNGKQWDKNTDIQDFKKANSIVDNHALQAYFNRRLIQILEKHNKKMIGWDEIMQPDLPKTAVIQSWRGKAGLTAAAKAGYQVLLSNGYYIDLQYPAKDHYLNDPLPQGIELTPEQKKLILGGEATMWSEIVTWETVDSRIWPRTAAIAERLWSPASIANVENMYKKLDVISIQLEEHGLTHNSSASVILRRLCQCEDIGSLQNLIKIIEPVKAYERAGSETVPYRSLSPFTRIVDAARADAPDARKFNNMVEQFLMKPDKENSDKLLLTADNWMANNTQVRSKIAANPVLKEIEPVLTDIDNCAALVKEFTTLISKKKRPSAPLVKKALETLGNVKSHKADVELAFLPGIEKLVDYAVK